VGPQGGVLAVFIEETKGRARIAARRTGAAKEPWGAEEMLSPEGEAVSDPVVAVGPGDRTLVAWTQGPFAKARVATARIE
jgi:hypothetical protein